MDEDGQTVTIRSADLSWSGESYDCPIPGDSGAPVILNHAGAETFADAKGVLSGGGYSDASGICVMISTGVEEAVQAWGGDLNFGS